MMLPWKKTLLLVFVLAAGWSLLFLDEPEKYGGADVDYSMGRCEAIFATTFLVPGIPLKRRDVEMRVIQGECSLSSKSQVKSRLTKRLIKPGERVVLSDLVPEMIKVVSLTRPIKAGTPITAYALGFIEEDKAFASGLASFGPVIGKCYSHDVDRGRQVLTSELHEFCSQEEFKKGMTFEIRSDNSRAGLTGNLLSYAKKLKEAIRKYWKWERPFIHYFGTATITAPAYDNTSHSISVGGNTEADARFVAALRQSVEECGLPPQREKNESL